MRNLSMTMNIAVVQGIDIVIKTWNFMRKYRLIINGLLILSVFLLFNLCNRNRKTTVETFNMDSATKEEVTDELVIALFIEDITKKVTNFYSEYYAGEIAIYNYEVTIVDIGKKEPGLISVQFGVTPQAGAHNPLGYDELAYRVDSSGNKELVGYEHLKTYEVSVKFQKYIIKPFE